MRKFISLFAAMLMVLTASAKTWPITPTQCHEGTRDDGYTLYVELERGAQDGDTILLTEDGEYLENQSLPVNHNVVIKAAEGKKPVVVMNGYFKIKASLIVEGITFKCKDGGQGYCFYFYDNSPKFLKMENCEFKEFTQYIASSWEKYHIDSCIVEDCYFHDLAKAPFYFSKSTLPNDTNACDNLTVKNSTFANITLSEVAVLDLRNNNNNTQATSKMRVDHCTFYNCKGYERMIQSYKSPDVEVCNCIMMNPLAEGEEESIYATYLYGGSVHHNLNYQTKRQYGSGVTVTDSICRDPQFVDAANADYTLAATSPALKAGSDGSNLGDPRWFPKAAALEAPDAAPAAPEWPANQVKAVYSATYGADCGFGEWGSGTVYTQETFGKKFVTTNLGYFGLTFEGDNALNCSSMEKLHLDIWIAADASIGIVPIHGGAEKRVTKNLVGQQWNSIEIALTEFEGVENWSNVYQIKLDNIAEKTFWVNNVYFYTTVVPVVDETAPAEFTAVADAASYFSANIKVKATDASGAIIYTVKNGEDIVATKNAASAAEAIITVKGLKPNTDYNFSVIAADESGNAAEAIAVATKTLAAPAAAPAPKTYKGLVKSIYSDAYATAPVSIGTLVAGWWEPTEMFEGELAEGDKALFYAAKETGMFGWEFAETDMTGYSFLHIDIYPLADGKIKIYPVVNGSTDDYVNIPDVKGGQWNHLVFD
ncbi:MAG: DUF4957 domain-containing protein, partial [Paludibacteraceae bacterium]|nr:DUF4957 domain-containing protein [Paludibacteraceae bacterium]